MGRDHDSGTYEVVDEAKARATPPADKPTPILDEADHRHDTVRQLTWAVAKLDATMNRVLTHVIPALTRLSNEMELARRGTLVPEPIAPKTT